MRQILLYGSNAARVFTLDDIGDGLRQYRVQFGGADTVLNDINRNVGINVSQDVIVYINDLVNLDDVLFPILCDVAFLIMATSLVISSSFM